MRIAVVTLPSTSHRNRCDTAKQIILICNVILTQKPWQCIACSVERKVARHRHAGAAGVKAALPPPSRLLRPLLCGQGSCVVLSGLHLDRCTNDMI